MLRTNSSWHFKKKKHSKSFRGIQFQDIARTRMTGRRRARRRGYQKMTFALLFGIGEALRSRTRETLCKQMRSGRLWRTRVDKMECKPGKNQSKRQGNEGFSPSGPDPSLDLALSSTSATGPCLSSVSATNRELKTRKRPDSTRTRVVLSRNLFATVRHRRGHRCRGRGDERTSTLI